MKKTMFVEEIEFQSIKITCAMQTFVVYCQPYLFIFAAYTPRVSDGIPAEKTFRKQRRPFVR